MSNYPYECVVTFGGCQDDFMVVVSTPHSTNLNNGGGKRHRRPSASYQRSHQHETTQRLLFQASKQQVHVNTTKAEYRFLH